MFTADRDRDPAEVLDNAIHFAQLLLRALEQIEYEDTENWALEERWDHLHQIIGDIADHAASGLDL